MRANRALAPQMVGRQAHLRELEMLLHAACQGSGRLVFLAGDAGVGKTRLVREFLRHARAQANVEILEGHCYDEDPAMPYGPFVHAIRFFMQTAGAATIARVSGPWTRDLAMLLPELGPPAAPETAEPQLHKQRLFAAIHHIIRPHDPHHCRVIVLEDLHWSDQTSQELIRYLARAIDRDRLLILATYRTDELHRRHPLTHLLAQLMRERLYQELRLDPLSPVELTDMLQTTLERPLPPAFVQMLYTHTEGNPFFVEEVLKALIAQTELDTLLHSIQAGQGSEQLTIPLSIKDSILRRTAELDPTTAEVLTYAAVIGRHFDFEILLRLTGLAEAELLRVVALLVERQLVVEEPDATADRYRFRHALTREAIYDDLLGRERRIKHRRVLQVLEETYPEDQEPVIDQLAYHSLHARETAQAAYYARRAAERAARMYAYREAVAHYEVALELLDSADLHEQAGLYERLGDLAHPIGDSNRYLRCWREAQRLYQQAGETIKVADIHRRLGRVLWDRGDRAGAFAHVQSALSLLETAPPGYELAMAYSTLSQLHMLAFQQEESIAWGQRALHLAEQLGDVRVQAHALNNIGTSLAEIGDIEQGIACLERSMALARQSHLTSDVVRAYNNLADRLAFQGEFKRSAALAREGLAFAEQVGLEEFTGKLRSILAWVEISLGHWEAARQLTDRATVDRPTDNPWMLLSKGALLFYQGEPAAARQMLEAVLPACEALNEPHMLEHALVNLAGVALALNDQPAARAFIERYTAIVLHGPVSAYDGNEFYYGIEVYLQLGAVESACALLARLTELVERKPTHLTHVLLAEARGLLALEAQQWQEAMRFFAQSVAGWQAMELPLDEAVAHRRLGQSLLLSSDPTDQEHAWQELATARSLLAQLGAPLELAAVDTLLEQRPTDPAAAPVAEPQREELTPRERQVIALLAKGYSNREIAGELVISTKTAEVHVRNILGKLGFSSRTQAAAYAVEQGLVEGV
ncbi:MAG: helix-turn-helix transcriptional regulator [Chloroflexaceae bacterium]